MSFYFSLFLAAFRAIEGQHAGRITECWITSKSGPNNLDRAAGRAGVVPMLMQVQMNAERVDF
jgi:hypothetical protein